MTVTKMIRDNPKTEEIVKDIRLDRLVSWILMTIVGVGIMIAGYTYKSLNITMSNLNSSVTTLNTNVAVLQTQILEISELKRRVRELEINQARIQGKAVNP